MIIGIDEIKELENIIFKKFQDFRKIFYDKYSSDIFDPDNYKHIDSIWTCFINGKGKGYELNEYEWEGVFKTWMNSLMNKIGVKWEIEAESWYRVDFAVVDYFFGGWLKGKYIIRAFFQQENNPNEIAGHVREYYDFNVPNKILLIWTNQTNLDPKNIIGKAIEVKDFCTTNRIKNIGNIIVIVGDWEQAKYYLQNNQTPTNSIFATEIIDSSI